MPGWIGNDPAPDHRVDMAKEVRPVRRIHIVGGQFLSGEIQRKSFSQAWAPRSNEYRGKPLKGAGRTKRDWAREYGWYSSCVVSRSLSKQ